MIGAFMILITASTFICGMWIKENHITDLGSLKFHIISGGISVFLIILYFIITIKKP